MLNLAVHVVNTGLERVEEKRMNAPGFLRFVTYCPPFTAVRIVKPMGLRVVLTYDLNAVYLTTSCRLQQLSLFEAGTNVSACL
jgi:hypothetical protein